MKWEETNVWDNEKGHKYIGRCRGDKYYKYSKKLDNWSDEKIYNSGGTESDLELCKCPSNGLWKNEEYEVNENVVDEDEENLYTTTCANHIVEKKCNIGGKWSNDYRIKLNLNEIIDIDDHTKFFDPNNIDEVNDIKNEIETKYSVIINEIPDFTDGTNCYCPTKPIENEIVNDIGNDIKNWKKTLVGKSTYLDSINKGSHIYFRKCDDNGIWGDGSWTINDNIVDVESSPVVEGFLNEPTNIICRSEQLESSWSDNINSFKSHWNEGESISNVCDDGISTQTKTCMKDNENLSISNIVDNSIEGKWSESVPLDCPEQPKTKSIHQISSNNPIYSSIHKIKTDDNEDKINILDQIKKYSNKFQKEINRFYKKLNPKNSSERLNIVKMSLLTLCFILITVLTVIFILFNYGYIKIGLIVSVGLSLVFIIYVVYLSSLNNTVLTYDMNKNLIDNEEDEDKKPKISFFKKLYYKYFKQQMLPDFNLDKKANNLKKSVNRDEEYDKLDRFSVVLFLFLSVATFIIGTIVMRTKNMFGGIIISLSIALFVVAYLIYLSELNVNPKKNTERQIYYKYLNKTKKQIKNIRKNIDGKGKYDMVTKSSLILSTFISIVFGCLGVIYFSLDNYISGGILISICVSILSVSYILYFIQ